MDEDIEQPEEGVEQEEVQREPLLDDEGNPEFDDEGNALFAEAEGEEEEAEPEPDEEPAAPEFNVPTGELPESQRLREALADPDLTAMIEALVDAKVARAGITATASQAHMASIAVESPELFRKYGAKAAAFLAQDTSGARTTRAGVEGALVLVALQDHVGKPSIRAVLRELADSWGEKNTPAPRPKTVTPPAQRVPTPMANNRGERTTSPRERRLQALMKNMKISRMDAETVLSGGGV